MTAGPLAGAPSTESIRGRDGTCVILTLTRGDATRCGVAALLHGRIDTALIVCSDPVAALDACRTGPPDIVVIDAMSGADALGFLTAMRTIDTCATVPAMLITDNVETGFAVRALYAGANDVVSFSINPAELLARIVSMSTLGRAARLLFATATVDELTGLATRRYFFDNLEREVARTSRYAGYLSVLAIDVDHFKDINDTWGHAAGDIVLGKLGSAILGVVRETDIAGRVGGDEFSVILVHANAEAAVAVAERLRYVVARDIHGAHGSLTISIGVATVNESESASQFFARADDMLYVAKRQGRNMVVRSTIK